MCCASHPLLAQHRCRSGLVRNVTTDSCMVEFVPRFRNQTEGGALAWRGYNASPAQSVRTDRQPAGDSTYPPNRPPPPPDTQPSGVRAPVPAASSARGKVVAQTIVGSGGGTPPEPSRPRVDRPANAAAVGGGGGGGQHVPHFFCTRRPGTHLLSKGRLKRDRSPTAPTRPSRRRTCCPLEGSRSSVGRAAGATGRIHQQVRCRHRRPQPGGVAVNPATAVPSLGASPSTPRIVVVCHHHHHLLHPSSGG